MQEIRMLEKYIFDFSGLIFINLNNWQLSTGSCSLFEVISIGCALHRADSSLHGLMPILVLTHSSFGHLPLTVVPLAIENLIYDYGHPCYINHSLSL